MKHVHIVYRIHGNFFNNVIFLLLSILISNNSDIYRKYSWLPYFLTVNCNIIGWSIFLNAKINLTYISTVNVMSCSFIYNEIIPKFKINLNYSKYRIATYVLSMIFLILFSSFLILCFLLFYSGFMLNDLLLDFRDNFLRTKKNIKYFLQQYETFILNAESKLFI